MMTTHGHIQVQAGGAAWIEYRRRIRVFAAVVASLVCCAAPTNLLFRPFLSQAVGEEMALWCCGAPWALAWVVAVYRYAWWPCPSCGRPFFYGLYFAPWAHSCMHCGLPKWSEPETHTDTPPDPVPERRDRREESR